MLKVLFSLFFLFSISAYAEEFFIYETQHGVAKELLRQFKQSNKQLLMIGESGHEEPAALQFFADMYDDTFDFIALEIGADQQAAIDEFMNSKRQTLPILSGRLKDIRMRLIMLQFLKRLRRINRMAKVVGFKPIEVLAVDKPQDEGKEGDWFRARDQHMFDLLEKRIQAGQKGLIYMGGGHLTKNPLPTPQILRERMGMGEEMLTFGSLVEKAFPDQTFRVWLDAPVPQDVAADKMPEDMQFLVHIDDNLRAIMVLSGDKVFATTTNYENFVLAEHRARKPTSIAFSLVKDFDYFVSLPKKEREKKPVTDCESNLK